MIDLRDLAGKSSLLTRSAADEVVAAVGRQYVDDQDAIEFSLQGIVAITPSFLDQLLGGLFLNRHGKTGELEVRLHDVPTRASEKYLAVARGHGLVLNEPRDGDWYLRGGDSGAVAAPSGQTPAVHE